ncbi:MAG: hypothetical protein WAK55_08670 [Xanthobacteraceae bacterium]
MTRALPFTKAGLCRRIEAVLKAGLRVTAIRPDGTVVVGGGSEPVARVASVDHDEKLARWEDVKA